MVTHRDVISTAAQADECDVAFMQHFYRLYLNLVDSNNKKNMTCLFI